MEIITHQENFQGSDIHQTLTDHVVLSKNKIRKLRKYKKRLENRQSKRVEEKLRRKELKTGGNASSPNKHRRFRGNDEKLAAAKKLEQTLNSGPKVVIDCQYESRMSDKEKKRFAQQIRRAYSSNRVATVPVHLYLSSLPETCDFYKVCCSQNAGFANYVLTRTSESISSLFKGERLIYLTPDSPNDLVEFNPTVVYVIGGIVDETTAKSLSLQTAEKCQVETARIPIDKYFCRAEKGTFKYVLTINQVVDIVLKWYETLDWVSAIEAGLPQRAGFVPRPS